MERGERMRKKRDSVLFIQGLGTGGWMRVTGSPGLLVMTGKEVKKA